ncbi:MAG: NRDE family protein [Candidatus Nezhaarchaeota archaeon]|nr:NRDE family protein [Candidatus Nezhaarchaeota archaeon]MCX8142178.1 NRDE family protein [Candidatus Nezhaarchaeota archaeon]MDW8050039.1 NRDE family protein [Nitrososphaerota archaeon]
MCTLILLYNFLKDFPVIAVHNRYVPVGFREEAPRVAIGRFKVYHPVDPLRGTWIGFNEKGLFAAVTDQRTLGAYRARYKSRGLLLIDILSSFSGVDEALNHLERELIRGEYKRGNFILASSRRAYHVIHDERMEVEPLSPGFHVVTSLMVREWMDREKIPQSLLRYVDMRRRRAVELVSRLEPTSIDDLIEKLKLIASDHGSEVGRGSICYHSGGRWHMSSSTIVVVSNELNRSRILYCRGNPCRGRFMDYSHIILN